MTTAIIQATTKNATPTDAPRAPFFARFDRARHYRKLASEASARAAQYRAQHERLQREIADLKEARKILVDALRKNGVEVEERAL